MSEGQGAGTAATGAAGAAVGATPKPLARAGRAATQLHLPLPAAALCPGLAARERAGPALLAPRPALHSKASIWLGWASMAKLCLRWAHIYMTMTSTALHMASSRPGPRRDGASAPSRS